MKVQFKILFFAPIKKQKNKNPDKRLPIQTKKPCFERCCAAQRIPSSGGNPSIEGLCLPKIFFVIMKEIGRKRS